MSAGHVETMLEMEIPENPFPGLRPFEFNESLLYFGRDGQSEQLLRKLSATRFLAVVGTSGSGKSSLVRAGLLPALLGGFMTNAGSNWQIALMRPGFDPIGNLARSLAAPDVLGSGGDPDVLAAMAESTLRRGNFGLMDLAQQARIGPRQNLLIVADQFEELFRVAGFAESEAYRNRAAAFVKLLLEACRQRDLPIYVVLTMRSDFLGDCSSFWGLPEAINEGQYLIPRLTREQRREAITGPIAVCGGAITDRLVTRLLNDMGDDQDQLPLLQHALMRTWVKWRAEGAGRTAIDLEDYESIGGMSEALSLHVDEAFNSLPDERSRQLAEKVFKGLTEKGSDNREIRRPVMLSELSVVTGTDESELCQVIDTFRHHGRSFLMPPAEVRLTPAAMIDISHESLIRNWKRLKGWVDEEARSARIYRRLAETAALFREGKAGLWRDPDLQVALTWREQSRPNKEWAERYHQDFDQAMDFLDKSLAERGAEQLAREAERRDKEVRRCRQVRNARVTTVAVALALMVSLGTLVYANRQKQLAILRSEETSTALDEANRQKKEAILQSERANRAVETARAETAKFEKEEKKAKASAILAEKSRLAALAQKAIADEQKEQALRFLYAADFNLAQRTHDAKDFARADDLLNNPKTEESRGFEWYHLWNRYHGAERTIKGYERSLTSVAFSPTQKSLLVTGSADGTLALVDSESGNSESLNNTASSVWWSIFSPDGHTLAVLGDSNTVELWDVANRQRLSPLPQQPEDPEIKCMAFWREGKLATGNEDGTITIWGLDAPHNRELLPNPNSKDTAVPDVGVLAASPTGDILASGYENGVLRIWNPASVTYGEPRFKHGKITALAVSPDGHLLAAATADGWLAIWATAGVFRPEDFKEGQAQWEPLFEKEILSKGFNCLAFSENGKELATAGTDGVVAFWDMQRLRHLRSWLEPYERAGQSAKPDSELEARIQQRKAEYTKTIASRRDTLPVEHGGPITCVAYSGNGHTFASGSADRTVKLWRLDHGRNEEKGAISPDGRFVATVEPNAIKVLEARQLRNTFPIDPNRKVLSMVFSPDSTAIVAGLDDGTVKLYQPKRDKEIVLSKGKKEVSGNASFIADWDGDVVRILDTSRGEVSYQFPPRPGFEIKSQGISPDSKVVAVSYSDGAAKLYYVETAEEFEIARMGNGNQRVFFSPGGKFLSQGSRASPPPIDTQFVPKTWNLDERRLARKEELDTESELEVQRPNLIKSSPREDKTAAAKGDSITLYDANTKKTITKKADLFRVTSLAFSPDGKTLASGGLDGTVKLWNAANLDHLSDIAALKKADGHLNPIVSLAFSSDSRRLAMFIGSDASPGMLVVWDLLSRQKLLRLSEPTPPPSLAFSAADMALGSYTLGRIRLGVREEERVTQVSPKKIGSPGALTWMSSRDGVAIPGNALIGGYSSGPNSFLPNEQNVFLNVCRLRYENRWYVGYTSGGDCHIGDAGSKRGQFSFRIYEVLVNANSVSWIPGTRDRSGDRSSAQPRVLAGKQDDGREVAVCRVTDKGGTYIGWIAGDGCHVYGRRPPVLKFEILHERDVERTLTASSSQKAQ